MIGRHGWITSTFLYVTLLVFPILLYVFFYQESRVDEATMRNFRSLGTAADRINDALATFRSVSENYSLGVDHRLLKEIISSCRGFGPWVKKGRELQEMVDILRDDPTTPGLNSKTLRIGHPSKWCIYTGLDALEKCDAGEHVVRLGQRKVFSRDCRTLSERDNSVYDALKNDATGQELMHVLDNFGIEVSRDIEDIFDIPTRHLSLFFDNYYVADVEGAVVFANQPTTQSHDDHRRHRIGVPFVSLATVSDLLARESPTSFAAFGSEEPEAPSRVPATPTGHSTIRHIQVGDVDLSVFIHPFTANGLRLNVVGVVLSSSLAQEATRIRLGSAADALLVIAILLALLPIFRFWTGGDRRILRRLSLYSVGGSVLGASALAAVLLSGVNFKLLDGQALDRRLESISTAIAANFQAERSAVERGLMADSREMGLCSSLLDDYPPPDRGIKAQITCPVCRPIRHALPPLWPTTRPLWAPEAAPKAGTNTPTLARLAPGSLEPWRGASRNRSFQGWWPTSSFLLDNRGKRAICKQYRPNMPLALDLAFRNYFTDANDQFGLYIIDSVLRSTVQMVGSIAPTHHANRERFVAVAIHKFWSIDPILPPSFQYAILDRSGRTIFHSDKARNSVSNFIDDTTNDVSIQAAVTYKRGATLDANYDGMPIRVHLMKLDGKEGWLLAVFRNHALVDKVASLASSLSVMLWVATALGVFLILALLAAFPRPLGKRLLPAIISSSTDVKMCFVGLALSAAGLLIVYGVGGHASVLVATLWPAVVGIIIVAFAWLRLRRKEERLRTSPASSGRRRPFVLPCSWRRGANALETWSSGSTYARAWALLSLVFSFSVVPTLAWQSYFLTQISSGVAAYLEDRTTEEIRERWRHVRQQTKRLAYVGGADLRPGCRSDGGSLHPFWKKGLVDFEENVTARVRRALCEGGSERSSIDHGEAKWPFGTLAPVTAYSPVTWQAMWYRSNNQAVTGVRTVSDAIDHVSGEPGYLRSSFGATGVWRWLIVSSGVVFVFFLCYSAVRVKFGYARRIVVPRQLFPRDLKVNSMPKRLQLIVRSEKEVKELKDALCGCFSVKCLKWRGIRAAWEEHRTEERSCRGLEHSEPKPVVFVVEHFRDATTEGRARWLMAELVERSRDGAVVICSDVVPLYHMSPGTVDDRVHMQPTWGNEWRELMANFEVRLLRSKSKDTMDGMWSGVEAVDELLGPELRADPDFEDVVRDIATGVKERGGLSGAQSRESALREFRAASQSKFKTLWAASSFDERAQLYALAHGGSLNMRRPAAISSLVARGLITDSDPIRLCSEAFGQFVVEDLDDSLADWSRRGHGDWWRITWLPLVMFAGLGLLFFINSNPEAIGVIGAVLAAFVGLVPIVISLFRAGQVIQTTTPSGDD